MNRLIVLAVVALMPQPVWAQPGEPYQVGTENTRIVDASRRREIGIKFYYPKDVTAPAAVILISHGGLDSDRGVLRRVSEESYRPHLRHWYDRARCRGDFRAHAGPKGAGPAPL